MIHLKSAFEPSGILLFGGGGGLHKPGLSLSASETQELKEKREGSSERSRDVKVPFKFQTNQCLVHFDRHMSHIIRKTSCPGV